MSTDNIQKHKASNLYDQLLKIQNQVDVLLLAAYAQEEEIYKNKPTIFWPEVFERLKKDIKRIKTLAGSLENDICYKSRAPQPEEGSHQKLPARPAGECNTPQEDVILG